MKLPIFSDPVTYSQSPNYMHTSLHGYRIDPLYIPLLPFGRGTAGTAC